MAFDYKTMV